MNFKLARLLTIIGLFALVTTAAASADEGATVRASLSGFNEVPPKATMAVGTFKATVRSNKIEYTLTYSGLTGPALFAHLHFGQPGVNGGIFAFLCGGGGKPPCPGASGTISGTITAADIVFIASVGDQDVTPGDFATAIRIIESGDAYANVHSPRFPAGEIRGQVSPGNSD